MPNIKAVSAASEPSHEINVRDFFPVSLLIPFFLPNSFIFITSLILWGVNR